MILPSAGIWFSGLSIQPMQCWEIGGNSNIP